jgi:hypothetical protein
VLHCRDAKKHAWQDIEHSAAPLGHAAIEHHLRHSSVHRVVSHTISEFSHESYVLELRDSASGHITRALFKPRSPGDFDGWHRVPIERVAYTLSRLLGMDVVPPCVYRGDLDVGGSRFSKGGALLHFVDGARPLSQVDPHAWGVNKEALLSDTRILVCLAST